MTMSHSDSIHPGTEFEVLFESLFDAGRGYAFPCDLDGRVDIDTVSERARNNYLFARAMVGRDFAMPVVREAALS
jgi:hypothetical protein